jgi:hypothetical protein
VTDLVVVAPLKPGAAERARELLAEGPPFDLDQSVFHRHTVHLSDREAVFVFHAAGSSATLELSAEDPELLRAASAWNEVLAERPRIARAAFEWERAETGSDVSYAATPGPGDSDGGEIYAPRD